MQNENDPIGNALDGIEAGRLDLRLNGVEGLGDGVSVSFEDRIAVGEGKVSKGGERSEDLHDELLGRSASLLMATARELRTGCFRPVWLSRRNRDPA